MTIFHFAPQTNLVNKSVLCGDEHKLYLISPNAEVSIITATEEKHNALVLALTEEEEEKSGEACWLCVQGRLMVCYRETIRYVYWYINVICPSGIFCCQLSIIKYSGGSLGIVVAHWT